MVSEEGNFSLTKKISYGVQGFVCSFLGLSFINLSIGSPIALFLFIVGISFMGLGILYFYIIVSVTFKNLQIEFRRKFFVVGNIILVTVVILPFFVVFKTTLYYVFAIPIMAVSILLIVESDIERVENDE